MLNIKKLIKQMDYLSKTAKYGELNLEIYCDMYEEWLRLMTHLGPYIKMGFKSIEDNIMHFKSNRDTMVQLGFIKKTDKEYTDLMKFCQLETQLGIQAFNEATNDDIFDEMFKKNKAKTTAKPGQKRITEDMRKTFDKYQSTSRTLLRGAWFFDYTNWLFKTYPANPEMSMAELARTGYDECGLAARHPWYVSTPARWAMGLINSRKEFNELYLKEEAKQYTRTYQIEEMY